MRRKNHSIMKELNQSTTRFDNLYLNKLLAYTAIINSLNYKWYKSSKRRFLLPNFYFTRSFYNFYNLYFSKHTFRKRIQPNHTHTLFSSFFLFEKKMFLKHVIGEDFFKESNSYFFFFNNKTVSFLKKDRFFFKKAFSNSFSNSNLFVSKNIDINLDTSFKLNLFKKNLIFFSNSVDFNYLLFFNISFMSVLEIYKILILLNLNLINDFK